MRPEESPSATRSLRRHAVFGAAVMIFLVGGIGAWAAMTHISGAVIASGQVVVESNAKKVQHPEGGVIAELRVKEGDMVKAGDLIIRLDDTLVRANLQIVVKQIDELLAQEARLLAERDGVDEIAFPKDFLARAEKESDVAAAIKGHKTIFENGVVTRKNRREQLEEQVKQLSSSIEGLEVQRDARQQELELIKKELATVEDLLKKGQATLPRFTALQRDRTRIDGERGKLVTDIAAAKGSIAEKRIAILRLDDDFRGEVVKGLAETRAKLAELVERRSAAEDRLARILVRSPQAGRVHGLSVHTVGGVLQASETAMMIVPQEDKLLVDAAIDPADIDEVRLGQKAIVKFTAFSDRQLKDIDGEVINVSPNTFEDQATKRRYYMVKIKVDQALDSQGKLLPLVPGMPVEAFLTKGDRTVLAYLLKPLRDQFDRVWKE
jgi:HlyD family secretion protein